jgi:hypothetical protein
MLPDAAFQTIEPRSEGFTPDPAFESQIQSRESGPLGFVQPSE